MKLESLSISEIQANNIKVTTRLQSRDPKWLKIRQDRITAFLPGSIIRRRKVTKTAHKFNVIKKGRIHKFEKKPTHLRNYNCTIFKIILMYKNCKGY